MNKQEFNGQVGYVAGRDIINVGAQMLWDCDTTELTWELKRCKAKLWQMRRDIFFSIPFWWFLAGVIGSVWLLLSDAWFKIAGQFWMFAWMIGAMAIPSMWLATVRQRKGKMVAYYRERIEIIDTILQDRR
ncbi:hypothetical protein [Rhodocyclus tenuis]|uniref:Uncharacterized protein n=1 Tax=Rhodocyclus tenuis TaxID=1066 RepID=A0A840G3P5_RHOTE|nr:hypothetical protein [Rhodocyclus tenuis]MBB4246546.1 hypothetical protein [Rhodocyclus tenuis]